MKLPPSIVIALWGAAVLRGLLLLWGEVQDSLLEVKYTDVDYLVFSDAARLVAAGRSPFERATYRYSPLLAWVLLPNVYLHPSFGKVLFSAADVAVGWLAHRILLLRGCSPKVAAVSVAAGWLFNPFLLTVSTRGNCEALPAFVLLMMLACLLARRVVPAAALYGLAVHFRVYPIIYALPLMLSLDSRGFGGRPLLPTAPWFTVPRLLFAFVSAATCLALTAVCWMLYGAPYISEAIAYHVGRRDPRHSFSAHFYPTYLGYAAPPGPAVALALGAPQWAAVVGLALAPNLAADLPACLFAQTLAFVALNKVYTAQYFAWFCALLPLVLPGSGFLRHPRATAALAVTWAAALLNWLSWAYALEFQGRPVFRALWVASVLFLAAHAAILVFYLRTYTPAFFFALPMPSPVVEPSTSCPTGVAAASVRRSPPRAARPSGGGLPSVVGSPPRKRIWQPPSSR